MVYKERKGLTDAPYKKRELIDIRGEDLSIHLYPDIPVPSDTEKSSKEEGILPIFLQNGPKMDSK